MSKLFAEIILRYFENQLEFRMPFYNGIHIFKIKSLEFGYDSATVICQTEPYKDIVQAISLSRLEDVLLGREIPPMRFMYVNRWFDEVGIPHYHGIFSVYPTLVLAQKHTVFTMLDVPVDLIYQATSEEDMLNYLEDVKRNQGNQDNEDGLGTMGWL
jgi:hypothetical protein